MALLENLHKAQDSQSDSDYCKKLHAPDDETRHFLIRNPDLGKAVQCAIPAITELFGEVEIEADLQTDTDDSTEVLALEIRSKKPVAERRTLLRKFMRELPSDVSDFKSRLTFSVTGL